MDDARKTTEHTRNGTEHIGAVEPGHLFVRELIVCQFITLKMFY